MERKNIKALSGWGKKVIYVASLGTSEASTGAPRVIPWHNLDHTSLVPISALPLISYKIWSKYSEYWCPHPSNRSINNNTVNNNTVIIINTVM